MRTDDLIVQLAREVVPVRPLAAPSVRLIRWLALVIPITAVAVLALGPRPDLAAALHSSVYLARGVTTFATAALAAATALVLSVPGAERSRYQRYLPFVAGALWILTLAAVLNAESDAAARLAAWPVNPRCLYQIAGLSAVPGCLLFTMLRRAAPLQPGWNALLAALAAVAAGAAGTQLLCPVDDAAHQIVGHVVPVAAFTVIVALAGRPLLRSVTLHVPGRP